MKTYEAKNFDHLMGTEGFSDRLMKNHFTLYQGYVNNTNKLMETLFNYFKEGKTGDPEYAELKRRFGWEFNGMRLHEYFFGGMAKGEKKMDSGSALLKKITEQFGSFENFEKDFKATSLMRGIGWTILYYDDKSGNLINVWINEHDVGHLSGLSVLLNIDVFEHAYMIDYDTKRADYIDAFLKAVDWGVVEKRFEDSLH